MLINLTSMMMDLWNGKIRKGETMTFSYMQLPSVLVTPSTDQVSTIDPFPAYSLVTGIFTNRCFAGQVPISSSSAHHLPSAAPSPMTYTQYLKCESSMISPVLASLQDKAH